MNVVNCVKKWHCVEVIIEIVVNGVVFKKNVLFVVVIKFVI